MCGLCGSVSMADLTNKQRLQRGRVIESLLVANMKRGRDAAGVATVNRKGVTKVTKKAVDAMKFIERKDAKKAVRRADARVIIGHTRLGTMGQNTDENAHPFREGNVVGAHNGMIFNNFEMDEVHTKVRGTWDRWAAVDSQVIFRELSDNEPTVAGITKALTVLDGLFAITWTDKRDPDGLYMFAHDNPISVGVVPRVGTMFWSSQEDHLGAALWSAYGKDWYGWEIPEDTVFRFPLDNVMDYDAFNVTIPKPTKSYGGYSSGRGPTYTDYCPLDGDVFDEDLGRCHSCGLTYSEAEDEYEEEEAREAERAGGKKKGKLKLKKIDDGAPQSADQKVTQYIEDLFARKAKGNDKPLSLPLAGMAIDNNITTETRAASVLEESCDMCKRGFKDADIDDLRWFPETDNLLCVSCYGWWERSGSEFYTTLGEAIGATASFGLTHVTQ